MQKTILENKRKSFEEFDTEFNLPLNNEGILRTPKGAMRAPSRGKNLDVAPRQQTTDTTIKNLHKKSRDRNQRTLIMVSEVGSDQYLNIQTEQKVKVKNNFMNKLTPKDSKKKAIVMTKSQRSGSRKADQSSNPDTDPDVESENSDSEEAKKIAYKARLLALFDEPIKQKTPKGLKKKVIKVEIRPRMRSGEDFDRNEIGKDENVMALIEKRQNKNSISGTE
jgi:hypothetical protein